MWMGEKGVHKRVLEWKPAGRRIRERPRKRWIEDIEENIQSIGIRGWRKLSGPGTLVGIATGYGLNGPGIETRCGRDFPHLSRPALGLTQLLV
jgi:hypothetical protein